MTTIIDPRAGTPANVIYTAGGTSIPLAPEPVESELDKELEGLSEEDQLKLLEAKLAEIESQPEEPETPAAEAASTTAVVEQPAVRRPNLEEILEFAKSAGGTPEELRMLQERFEALQALREAPAVTAVPKNHRQSKATGCKYVLLAKSLNMSGRVPQQQADLAAILAKHLPVNVEVPEEQVFKVLEAERDNYESLRRSKQHVTYLFRYYRGLKPAGSHAGFVARGFLRQVA